MCLRSVKIFTFSLHRSRRAACFVYLPTPTASRSSMSAAIFSSLDERGFRRHIRGAWCNARRLRHALRVRRRRRRSEVLLPGTRRDKASHRGLVQLGAANAEQWTRRLLDRIGARPKRRGGGPHHDRSCTDLSAQSAAVCSIRGTRIKTEIPAKRAL